MTQTMYRKRAPKVRRAELKAKFQEMFKEAGTLIRSDVEMMLAVSQTTALQYLRVLHKGEKCTYIKEWYFSPASHGRGGQWAPIFAWKETGQEIDAECPTAADVGQGMRRREERERIQRKAEKELLETAELGVTIVRSSGINPAHVQLARERARLGPSWAV